MPALALEINLNDAEATMNGTAHLKKDSTAITISTFTTMRHTPIQSSCLKSRIGDGKWDFYWKVTIHRHAKKAIQVKQVAISLLSHKAMIDKTPQLEISC